MNLLNQMICYDPIAALIDGGSAPDIKMPTQTAETPKKTSPALPQTSQEEKKNKRLAASMLTKNWMEPAKLSKKGLLGG